MVYKKGVKRLIGVRHSERVDKVFPGPPSWIERSLRGVHYAPFDGNLPSELPVRRLVREYEFDSPLTKFGVLLAETQCESLERAKIVIDAVHCSPTLRCVQTAALLSPDCKIKIDPFLHENFFPHNVAVENAYLSPQQLHAAGFPIDLDYEPLYEDVYIGNNGDYEHRFSQAIDDVLKEEESSLRQGTVLLVGHASLHDGLYGKLKGGWLGCYNTEGQYVGRFEQEPRYCQPIVFEKEGNTWNYVEDAVRPFTMSGFNTANSLRRQ